MESKCWFPLYERQYRWFRRSTRAQNLIPPLKRFYFVVSKKKLRAIFMTKYFTRRKFDCSIAVVIVLLVLEKSFYERISNPVTFIDVCPKYWYTQCNHPRVKRRTTMIQYAKSILLVLCLYLNGSYAGIVFSIEYHIKSFYVYRNRVP